jgi:hypothetical protein
VATKRKVPEEKAASIDQAIAAGNALTEAEIYQLERYAGWRISAIGAAADGRDYLSLLGEAFQQTLDGTRTWNLDKTFIQHLENSMQSISGNWAGKYRTQLKHGRDRIVSDTDSRIDLVESDAVAVDPTIAEEQEAEFEARLKTIRDVFDDDPVASVIMAGLEDGLSGKEIRAILDDMEETPYRTKVRWMQRKLKAEGFRTPTTSQKGQRS